MEKCGLISKNQYNLLNKKNCKTFIWLSVLFIMRFHVETVVLLSKGEVDLKKIRVEFSLEDMDMSEFQDGATYPQIKGIFWSISG